MTLSIDLMAYDELDSRLYGNLLLGNGFSIGVSGNFSYRSLYAAGVKQGDIDTPSQQLFKAFNTHDFEYLLRKLYQASLVNRILNIDHLTPTTKYNLIKESLIRSVRGVHPDFANIDSAWLERCSTYMSRMVKVFSLNYDLLPYWIAGHDGFSGYTDFFWSTGLTFDQFNTDVWGRKTEMFYPHGSLFIFENIDGSISKMRQKPGENILESIGDYISDFNIPIFVSEGTHEAKLRRIRQNPYLSFAYQKISDMTGGLIIYGTSLSTQDSHILDAVKRSRVRRIAYAIYPGTKDAHAIETEKQSIISKFHGNSIQIEFFDSTTCPLSY